MAQSRGREVRLNGLGISGGIALARVCRFNENRHSNLPIYKVTGEGATREKARFHQAISVANDRLDILIAQVEESIGASEAEIFKVHKMILNDSSIAARIVDDIESGPANAETAIARTLDQYEARLLDLDNEYIMERASDIGEVRRRLLDVLGNMNPSLQCTDEAHCQRGRNRIIVAEELTPSLTTELESDQILGFVTERGGPTSHAAILARALGIPAVSGIKGIHGQLSCGTELLINGDTGEVVVWPSESTLKRLRASQDAIRTPKPVAPVAGLTVMANISRSTDVHEALTMQAEGVGLYRTEFEFLAVGKLLNEAEQFERYSLVAQAFEGQPVYFRMLDIGTDKTAPFFGLPQEENPALGLRGSRLLLARPELLKTQARALARASVYSPIHVMYPMVIDLEQFLELKRLFNEAVTDIDIPTGRILHGLTFEVPSACLQARELMEVADFASIGTNDLVQYLFAVDRNNEQVAHDYVPDRPILWSMLGQIAQAANETNKPISVCGEMAGDPSFLPQLMQLGIRTVSVSPRRIPDVRLTAKASLSSKTPSAQPTDDRQRRSA